MNSYPKLSVAFRQNNQSREQEEEGEGYPPLI